MSKREPLQHVVFFSGGAGSFATTHRILNEPLYGVTPENLHLLFTDTTIEHKTQYKFILQACQHFYRVDLSEEIELAENLTNTEVDQEKRKLELQEIQFRANEKVPNLHWLHYQVDGRSIDPWDIFYNDLFIGNSRAANCSKILKQRMARDFVKEYWKPEQIKTYMGIDWTEIHRTEAPERNWFKCCISLNFPLCHYPLHSKEDSFKAIEESGIEIPNLYKDGFEHGNCGGFCVRAGQSHFRNLLKTNEPLMMYHARKEMGLAELIREAKNTDEQYSILKKTKDGITSSFTLFDLVDEVKNETKQADLFAVSDSPCGCFSEGLVDEIEFDGRKWGLGDLKVVYKKEK